MPESDSHECTGTSSVVSHHAAAGEMGTGMSRLTSNDHCSVGQASDEIAKENCEVTVSQARSLAAMEVIIPRHSPIVMLRGHEYQGVLRFIVVICWDHRDQVGGRT